MAAFLAWINAPAPTLDPVLRAGVDHLWFVTIHSFDDGNGRVVRALTDLLLARADAKARLHPRCPTYLLYQVLRLPRF